MVKVSFFEKSEIFSVNKEYKNVTIKELFWKLINLSTFK